MTPMIAAIGEWDEIIVHMAVKAPSHPHPINTTATISEAPLRGVAIAVSYNAVFALTHSEHLVPRAAPKIRNAQ